VVGVSIGPNATTVPEARTADYLELLDRFAPLADYLALNVSSPNTPGLRSLETARELERLLGALIPRRDWWRRRLDRPVPVLVKLSPDLDDPEAVVRVVEARQADGIIMGNTTTARPEGIGDAVPGGLSGAPLAGGARAALRRIVAATRLPIVASGGVMHAGDVRDRLEAGAALVQMYTGLVYAGPGLVRSTLRHLDAEGVGRT
jgi:dihydroorotate dehydrogenase